MSVDVVFQALGDPTRRAVLARRTRNSPVARWVSCFCMMMHSAIVREGRRGCLS